MPAADIPPCTNRSREWPLNGVNNMLILIQIGVDARSDAKRAGAYRSLEMGQRRLASLACANPAKLADAEKSVKTPSADSVRGLARTER